jgi:hypothetical protein
MHICFLAGKETMENKWIAGTLWLIPLTGTVGEWRVSRRRI